MVSVKIIAISSVLKQFLPLFLLNLSVYQILSKWLWWQGVIMSVGGKFHHNQSNGIENNEISQPILTIVFTKLL
jgi:hypothetical protein